MHYSVDIPFTCSSLKMYVVCIYVWCYALVYYHCCQRYCLDVLHMFAFTTRERAVAYCLVGAVQVLYLTWCAVRLTLATTF
jgi:hypothetical protein